MSVPPNILCNASLFHPAWIQINLNHLSHNLSVIRQKVGSRRICFVIKANAYGHGLLPIAKKASEEGVDYFGVAHLSEAITLRRGGIEKPILVLGAIHENQIDELVQWNLDFTISSPFKAKLVAERAVFHSSKCRVHIEVDTGMRRTGVRPETALSLIEYLLSKPCFDIVGVYSHFVMSETPNNAVTQKQIAAFNELKENVGSIGKSWIWHLANSGGVVFYPDSYLDMVRPGLIGYGFSPLNAMPELRPLLSLIAKISYFKVVEAKEGISYNHIYHTSSQTRVVTVPVGYGDGYRRDFSNRMSVLIQGRRFPIAGAVCMDQFMVDIGQNEAYVGDEVVLIGKQGKEEITLMELAERAKTDPREILCHFNDRIPRIYID